jgi:hypothetical protein
MRIYLALAIGLLITGCAQHPKTSTTTRFNHDYNKALWAKVAQEIDTEIEKSRQPATAAFQSIPALIGNKFSDLRGKNKSFEIYVFSKMNNKAVKTNESPLEVYLSKPIRMSVKVPYASGCAFLMSNFKDFRAAQYFPANYADNKGLNCAVIEITNSRVAELNRPLLRDGDELKKRIYIDDQYRVFGVETDYYSGQEGRLVLATSGQKFDGNSSTTAGIGFIPAEMPSAISIEKTALKKVSEVFDSSMSSAKELSYNYSSDKTVIDAIALKQIQRLNKAFKAPNCEFREINYQDNLGRSNRMYWCQGAAWPSVVDSGNFVAVTGLLK